MGSAINQKEEEMIVSAPQSTQYTHRFSCASTWNEPREFPNNPAAVDCQRHVLLYISAGKLINRSFDYDSDDFILDYIFRGASLLCGHHDGRADVALSFHHSVDCNLSGKLNFTNNWSALGDQQ
jgi:hypothetical protein